jgi:hypothetical protein
MAVTSQFGAKDEVSVGTPVVVDRFFEFNSENLAPKIGRQESKGMRANGWMQRSDRSKPYTYGAAGPVELDVLTKGFGFWLKHMLGAVAAPVTVETGVYAHVGTIASHRGKSFTCQVNRKDETDTDRPWTFAGSKIKEWSLASAVEGNLLFTADIDALAEARDTALATASYPTTAELLTWVGASLTIDGVARPAKDVKVTMNNDLDVDRLRQRGTTSKVPKEQINKGLRVVTVEFTADFDGMTEYNRVVADVESGAEASFVALWEGDVEIGATELPHLKVDIPALRFDQGHPNVGGRDPMELKITATAVDNGTDQPIEVEYQTADATP